MSGHDGGEPGCVGADDAMSSSIPFWTRILHFLQLIVNNYLIINILQLNRIFAAHYEDGIENGTGKQTSD